MGVEGATRTLKVYGEPKVRTTFRVWLIEIIGGKRFEGGLI
jgi:hypothetical protein